METRDARDSKQIISRYPIVVWPKTDQIAVVADASGSREKGHGSDYPPTATLKKILYNIVVL